LGLDVARLAQIAEGIRTGNRPGRWRRPPCRALLGAAPPRCRALSRH